MVATSGAQLLPPEAVGNLRLELLPLATVLTPNIPEAELLLKDAGSEVGQIETTKDLIKVAAALQKLGPKWILLKGGHLPFIKHPTGSGNVSAVIDVLYGRDETIVMQRDHLDSKNTHGTGCSLACECNRTHCGLCKAKIWQRQ